MQTMLKGKNFGSKRLDSLTNRIGLTIKTDNYQIKGEPIHIKLELRGVTI